MKLSIFRMSVFCLLTGGIFVLNSCGSPKENSKKTTLTNQQDSTKYYVYKINYPDYAVTKPVADSIKTFALAQRQMFLDNQPSDTSMYGAAPYQLLVKIDKAFHSSQAVSYVANVYQFTGGAHGRSIIKTFNYDLSSGQFITMQNLFQDTTALGPVSNVAKQKIIKKYYQNNGQSKMNSFDQKWINNGTAPIVKNYRHFYLAGKSNHTATGIKIIFSPYQVGPHSIGMPQIFIPDSAFYQYLNPKFKRLFTNPG